MTPKSVLYTIVLKQQNVPFKIYHFSIIIKKLVSIIIPITLPNLLITIK